MRLWLTVSAGSCSLSSMLRIGLHTTTMCASAYSRHLAVGNWVLEFVSGVAPSLDSRVKGHFRVVGFVGPGGQILVLQTGPSEFPRACLF
jgi:hypothetical protein